MAQTNRHFDDTKIRVALEERFGLQIPDHIRNLRFEVEYLPPNIKLPPAASFNVSFQIIMNAQTADEILREQI